MKMFLKMLVPGVLLFSMLGGSAFAQSRIATVDLSRVFTNYWKFKQADAALQERRSDMAKDEKKLLDGWQKAKDDYQTLAADAGNQAVSSEERDKRKTAAEGKLKEIRSMEDEITQYRRQAGTTLNEQALRLRDNILTEIRTAVNAKAKSGGFNLVLDTAAQTVDRTPMVLFNSGENDLTEAVLDQLNASEPIDLPKPETTKSGDKKTESKGGK